MKKVFNKFLSIFLSIVLLITALPLFGIDLLINAEAKILSEYDVGDIIEFGSYPQSRVTDEELIFSLNQLSKTWVSYNYYSRPDEPYENTPNNLYVGKMVPSDFMKYADVFYNGTKYRAVFFSQYRPKNTGLKGSMSSSYQYNNVYFTNIIYWFKYEPLKWRVLDPVSGLVICENIVDSQPYNNTIYTPDYEKFYQDSNYAVVAYDYNYSSIREWLNEHFYKTAFTYGEKEKILIPEQYFNDFNSKYNDDYDYTYNTFRTNKVFLLPYHEAENSEYGLIDDDKSKKVQGTDYAKSQGLGDFYKITDNGYFSDEIAQRWLVLTPISKDTLDDRVYAFQDGDLYDVVITNTFTGVRPALILNPEAEIEHTYETVITPPTCTEQGYTTYTCSYCNHEYVSDFTDALGHMPGDVIEEKHVAPTCSKSGYVDNVTHCTVCNVETSRETIIIDALGHVGEIMLEVAPTCTETGLTFGIKCSVCDKVFITQQELPANGHKYDSTVTKPSCIGTGYTTYTCTACDDTYVDDETPATGHSFSNGNCTVCGETDPEYYVFSVKKPSKTIIRYKDGIVLHSNIEGTAPTGSYVDWSWNNSNFDVEKNSDGALTIISENNGMTIFTATLYSVDGEILATDSIEMISKAGFFDKIGGFFRSLFGSTKIYEN